MSNGYFDRLNTRCNKCNSEFEIEINNGVINSNMTAQRINNDYAHHKENCISYCLNCSRREKSIVFYMASKQDIIHNGYYDKGGFGSKNRTLQEATKKDNTITINGMNEFFRKNVE